MPVEGTVVFSPAGVYDVSSVLGDISQDVGTLCTSARINPCARFKPTIYNSIGENMHQWKAMDGNCGLVPKKAADLASLPGLYDGNMNGWVYNRPGASNFKRITDFDGYDHGAKMASIFCAGEATTQETRFPVMLAEFASSDDTKRRSLRFSDIQSLSDGYLGVYGKSGTKEFYFTAAKKLSETTASTVEINWRNRAGTWKLYPIFCTQYKADGGNLPSGQNIYTVPMASPVTVEVEEISNILYVSGIATQKEGSTSVLTLGVVAHNGTNSARNFGTVYWQIKQDFGALQSGDKQGSITDFGTIAANSSARRSIEVTGCADFIKRGQAVIRVYSSASGVGGREFQIHFLAFETPTVRPLD